MARNEKWTVRIEAIDFDEKTLEMPRPASWVKITRAIGWPEAAQ